jgi:hypothetical protein
MAPSPPSLPLPHPSTEGRAAAAPPGPAVGPGPGAAAALFVALLGLALGSFPARNADLWAHLAAGRALARGDFGRAGPTWLYDVLSSGLFQLAGGAGLVAVKAGLVAALAVVLLRLSRTAGGWLGPCACTVLALLALGRPPLAPVTASYLLLALAAGWAWRAAPAGGASPGWRPVALFAVWGNVDRWALLGAGVVALIRVGRWLDERTTGGRGLLRELGAAAVLAVAAAANPFALSGPLLPAELGWGGAGYPERAGPTSPFEGAYLSALGSNPAALAYYALFGLGLVAFLLALPRWRLAWALPWAALAALSAAQARAVPFFAVVAGPVLAWGLQALFDRRPLAVTGRGRVALAALTGVLAAAFLAAAWPGWLQRPPFEPRRWAAEPPAGLEQAAAAVRRGHAERAWPAGGRTLHLARDTADAFASFCPEDDGVLDTRLTEGTGAGERLAEAGVARVVIRAADRGPRAALARLLAEPERWPLFHLEGGVAVFAWRGPFRGEEMDLDRLAFRPADSEKAPPAPAPPRRWWAAFWGPASPPEGDRYQAAVLLLKAEVLRGGAPARHLAEWEAGQAAALAGAAAGWVGPGAADAALRATWFRPPLPARGEPVAPLTRFTFDSQRLFMLARDDAPPAALYAAVRAARRAVSAAPDDAHAHLLLGQCYLRLLTATRERAWALRLPQMAHLRQSQASAALNRAAALSPRLAQAHLELGRLYQRLGYNDLALAHLRAYREAGGGEAAPDAELADLAAAVERQRAELAPEVARARVADRARAALRRGLAGEARATLLESDVSAFGQEGTQLELELLLRTGRPEDVRSWAAAELKDSLGAISYHWLRTQALAALGEYAAADAELTELAGERGPDPARTSAVFAALTGRALLGEHPAGRGWPAAVSRVVARSQFRAALHEEVAGLAARADAAVVRGLLALEAGEVGRARAALQAALDYAAGGGVDFNGRPVAEDALRWLR